MADEKVLSPTQLDAVATKVEAAPAVTEPVSPAEELVRDPVAIVTGEKSPAMLGPSSPENQAETKTSNDLNKKVSQIKDMYFADDPEGQKKAEKFVARVFQNKTDHDQKIVDHYQKEDEAIDKVKTNVEFEQYKHDRELAQKQPEVMKSFEVKPVFEQKIADDQAVAADLVANPGKLNDPSAQTGQPDAHDLVQADKEVKRSLAMEKAQQLTVMEEQQKLEEQKQKATQDLEDTQAAWKDLDPNRFWKDSSVGEKVGLFVSMFIGGLGSGLTGKPNAAVQVINQYIDRDIQNQKLNRDQALAKKDYGLKLIQQQIDTFKAKTDNQMKLLQMDQLKAEIGKIRMETANKYLENSVQQQQMQAVSAMKASGKINPDLLDAKDRERAVPLPNGEYALAINPTQAREYSKYAAEAMPAIRRAKELKELIKYGNPASNTDRQRAKSLETALIGALRLPFTGPGVLTESEKDSLREAIGTMGIFQLDDGQKEKINQVIYDLNSSLASRAQLAGFQFPLTTRDKYIQDQRAKTGRSAGAIDKELDRKLQDPKTGATYRKYFGE